jgi:hypothetical protein
MMNHKAGKKPGGYVAGSSTKPRGSKKRLRKPLESPSQRSVDGTKRGTLTVRPLAPPSASCTLLPLSLVAVSPVREAVVQQLEEGVAVG